MTRKLTISVICPVFNEEQAVPLFFARLREALGPLSDRFDFEILFTNNASSDGTLDKILELRSIDPRVQVITLSRNFGYQASVTAGMTHATGDAVIVIDVDCEDPPELIPQFVTEWEKGHDIVYGQRHRRPEPWPVTFARRMFYRINRLIADSDIILDMAEFALIDKRVRDAVLSVKTTYPFLRTEIGYAGFKRKAIDYDRQKRVCGKTHYNFIGMVEFAVAGILASTTFFLRCALYLMPFVLVASLVAVAVYVTKNNRYWLDLAVAGNLMFLTFFLSFVSVYVARVYKNGIHRPVFIIDWRKTHLTLQPATRVNVHVGE